MDILIEPTDDLKLRFNLKIFELNKEKESIPPLKTGGWMVSKSERVLIETNQEIEWCKSVVDAIDTCQGLNTALIFRDEEAIKLTKLMARIIKKYDDGSYEFVLEDD